MNNRGSVMIFVLMTISFCVAVAMLVSENATDDFARSNTVRAYYQSTIFAATAVKGLRSILEDDDYKVDSPDDDWANVPTTPMDDGFINILVHPLNKRISIAGMSVGDNATRQRTELALTQSFDDNEIAEFHPNELKDWMDADTDMSDNGREDVIYESVGVRYRTKNAPYATLLELEYATNRKVYNGIKDDFHVINTGKRLNINFVSKQTLVLYLPELEPYADDIIAYRVDKTYNDISQIRKAAAIPDDIYQGVTPFLDEKSAFIYTLIEVNIAGVSRYYHALIQRNNDKTKLISFFEGGNERYF